MPSVNVTLSSPSAFAEPARRVAISTLGCKVNHYESHQIAQGLMNNQWRRVSSRDAADLYIINTCTVTQEADRQARQEVRRLIRQNPDAVIVVTGCYAQIDPQACAQIPGVDYVVGNDRKLDIHRLLSQVEKCVEPSIMVGELDQHVSLPDGLLTGFEGHTRAYVQIQQGCNQGCTFCIIHRARGPSRSISPSVVLRQAQLLVENGYQELVICGVDLGAYGEDIDSGHKSLSSLIKVISARHPGVRLRLSSIDPSHITDELMMCFAQGNVCPHLHLSLQSANTLILKRMKRRYDRELVYERIEKLRSKVPGLVISADIMTGFPTETDAQFEQTLQSVYDLKIAYPHVFPYSKRRATPASKIPAQVPIDVRKARAARVREAGNQVLADTLNQHLGQTVTVLTENRLDRQSGWRVARAENYLPALVPVKIEANKIIKVVNYRIENNSLFAQ